MTEQVVLYDVGDAVATITVNRPEKYNALNMEVKEALLEMFMKADKDESVRVVVLTGKGEKGFISGADVNDFVGRDSKTIRPVVESSRRISRHIESMSKPVVAAVNGYALGGGCEIAMACDIRYASVNARFGQPEINLGTIPGNGGTVRLARIVGLGIAKELVLTGGLISAEDAFRIGLVNRLFESVSALREGVADLATKLAKKPGVAVGLAKQSLNNTWRMSLDEHLECELEAFCQTFDTQDISEGVAAFLEKRKPEFDHQ
ncbi:MAG: enoyl-CoA hydratase/isomerase family protein [Candidatus Thorarchaeota archaeon]|nr:MAG: enoyl-CoA hydratase/isomerase family protein [Candidatus Thorarchaeota archaeon]